MIKTYGTRSILFNRFAKRAYITVYSCTKSIELRSSLIKKFSSDVIRGLLFKFWAMVEGAIAKKVSPKKYLIVKLEAEEDVNLCLKKYKDAYIDRVFEACGLNVNGEGDAWETNRGIVRQLISRLENWGLDLDNPTFFGVITNGLKYELIAQVQATEESTKVTEESTKVTEEGTQATEENTKVTEEGTQATEEGTQATEESTKVTEEGTQATEESTKVTEEGTQATEESTKVTEEGTQATEESTKVTEEGTQTTEMKDSIIETQIKEKSSSLEFEFEMDDLLDIDAKANLEDEEGYIDQVFEACGLDVNGEGDDWETNRRMVRILIRILENWGLDVDNPTFLGVITNWLKYELIAQEQAIEKSTKVTEEGTKVTEESTKVTEEGTQATEESTKVTEEGTQATEESTKVTEEGTQATEEGTQVTEESTKVTEEGTQATEESTKVTEEGTQTTEMKDSIIETQIKEKSSSLEFEFEMDDLLDIDAKANLEDEEGYIDQVFEACGLDVNGEGDDWETNRRMVRILIRILENWGLDVDNPTFLGVITNWLKYELIAQEQAIEKSTKVTEESTKVTEEGTQATEESTKVTEEGTQATEESTKVTEEGTQATEESTKVTEESTKVTEEGTQATEESTKVTEESTKVTEEGTQATEESTTSYRRKY